MDVRGRWQEREDAVRGWEERLAGARTAAAAQLRRTAEQASETEADLRKQLGTGAEFAARLGVRAARRRSKEIVAGGATGLRSQCCRGVGSTTLVASLPPGRLPCGTGQQETWARAPYHGMYDIECSLGRACRSV